MPSLTRECFFCYLSFVPWVFDTHYDYCAFMEGQSTIDALMQTFVKNLKADAPKLLDKCPIMGEHGMYSVNWPQMIEFTLPQIFLSGHYKALFRVYMKSSNNTYFNAWFTMEMKSVDNMQQWEF